jgi:hypothetical protein
MLVDEKGKRFDGQDTTSRHSFVLMDALLKAATKRLPFMNGPAAQVRQVAKECSKSWDWPEEQPSTIKVRQIYG